MREEFTLSQIKAAVILALKDVKDLSIPSLKRIANNPDDPRAKKAQMRLKKEGVGKDKKPNAKPSAKKPSAKKPTAVKKTTTTIRRVAKNIPLFKKQKAKLASQHKAVMELYKETKAKFKEKPDGRTKRKLLGLKEKLVKIKEQHGKISQTIKDLSAKKPVEKTVVKKEKKVLPKKPAPSNNVKRPSADSFKKEKPSFDDKKKAFEEKKKKRLAMEKKFNALQKEINSFKEKYKEAVKRYKESGDDFDKVHAESYKKRIAMRMPMLRKLETDIDNLHVSPGLIRR